MLFCLASITVCGDVEGRKSMTLPVTDRVAGMTLSELSKIARDAIAVADALWGIGQRRKDRRAAKNLYGIAFKPGGMRDLLQKISDGEATQETFDALEQLFNSSEASVKRHIDALKIYSDIFRERFGFDASIALEKGISFKYSLRVFIGSLIDKYRSSGFVASRLFAADLAGELVRDIEDLNDYLSNVHDRILSYEAKHKRESLAPAGEAKPNRRMTKPALLPNALDDFGSLPSGRRSRPPKKTA
jgi:hypothetical protein